MIVFCEDCGERYALDMEDTEESPHIFTCRRCDHVIMLSKEKSAYTEKRHFERIFFTMETGPRASFSVIETPNREFTAVVINISEEGMRMMAGKNAAPFLRGGGRIQINAIEGQPELRSLAGEKAEVRWILDNFRIPYVGFGCMWIDINAAIRRRLREMVAEAGKSRHERITG